MSIIHLHQEKFGPEGKADFLLQPQSLKDLGLPEIFLANLILKHSFYLDPFTLSDLVERLKLSANILTPLLEYLQKEKCVQIRGADPFNPLDGSFSFFSRYSRTDGGKKRAAQLLEYDAQPCGAGNAERLLESSRETVHQVDLANS